ncbi:MAG: 5-(carboxyamino)imidazole ribonucleotide synthase [Rhodospirillaceae bacterium]|nr:5-(carboxyamino)imidazole ribonucleotide synthase [Rhodospirillaceae bacterium]
MLPPGSTIGIVGGGQLGRMTALAAAPLGYRCHIFTPEADGPASQVSAETTVAGYDDLDTIETFARSVDVITYEFENIPVSTVERLAQLVPCRPGPRALEVAQHRVIEKTFAAEHGVPTAPFAAAQNLAEFEAAVTKIGRPSIVKTCRLGYDGKGQRRIDKASDLAEIWASLATDDAIVEGFIAFEKEVSVIVARGLDGTAVPFPVVENRHVNHILDTTIAPAEISPDTAETALRYAVALAEGLEIVGLLAVELFVGADGSVLMNEIAPRPHNSGHWTQDGCVTSQFEQHARAVAGLPLGPVDIIRSIEMQNLIGDAVDTWQEIVAEPGAKLHLYGKTETRPGRKMGHVNRPPANRR